jgi:hypothetical protein
LRRSLMQIPIPSFEEEGHIYKVDGRIIPSTTQILKEFVRIELYGEVYYVDIYTGAAIRADYFEAAGAFGRAFHKCFYYLVSGQGLDKNLLHPTLLPCLLQLERWMAEYHPKPIICEEPLYSRQYDYCGTLDFYGYLKGIKKRRFLVDLKTGLFNMAGPQTASYEQLVRENTGYKGIILRFVLHIPKAGSGYSFIPQTNKQDMGYFVRERANYEYRRAA